MTVRELLIEIADKAEDIDGEVFMLDEQKKRVPIRNVILRDNDVLLDWEFVKSAEELVQPDPM